MSRIFNRDAFLTTIRRLAFAAAFLLGLCVPTVVGGLPAWTPTPILREIARVISPDGRVDAVLTEERAKVFFGRSISQLRIVRHGMATAKGSLVFSAVRLANAQLFWTDPRLLEIRYDRARVDYFTSEGTVTPKETSQPIEIRLVPLSADFSYLRAASNAERRAEPPTD